MTQDIIAFWHSDMPPYYQADEVVEILNDGKVRVTQGIITPIALVPKEEGMAIKVKLSAASKEYTTAMKTAREELLTAIKPLFENYK